MSHVKYINIFWGKKYIYIFEKKNIYIYLRKYIYIYIWEKYIYFFLSVSRIFYKYQSVQFSHSVLSNSLWPHGQQHARPPCPSPTPRACSNSCLLRWWCHPIPHSLSSPSPPAFNLSQHQGLFKWVSSSHQVAKVLDLQLQHQFFQWIFRNDFL